MSRELLVRKRSTCERKGADDVPLARLLGLPDPPRGAALQARALPDRPESPRPPRRRDHQWGRLRGRLVRCEHPHAGHLPERRAGLERPQSARSRRPRRVAALSGAHPRLDRDARPTDQLPPVPLWPMALGPQRPRARLPARQASARTRRRRVVVYIYRRVDGFGVAVLSRAYAGP